MLSRPACFSLPKISLVPGNATLSETNDLRDLKKREKGTFRQLICEGCVLSK